MDYDGEGKFVRLWVEELEDLKGGRVHMPWTLNRSELENANLELGVDYPKPMLVAPEWSRHQGGGGKSNQRQNTGQKKITNFYSKSGDQHQHQQGKAKSKKPLPKRRTSTGESTVRVANLQTCLLLASGNHSLSNCKCTRLPLRRPSCFCESTTLSQVARRRAMLELKDLLSTTERLLLTCQRCKRTACLFLHSLVMILSAILVYVTHSQSRY